MTDRKSDEETIMDRLLSDDEFSDLMLASYERAGKPVDELAKRRIWGALSEQIGSGSRPSVAPRRLWAPAIAVALVILAVMTSSRPDETMRVKGVDGIPVDLFAYTLSVGGETQAAPDKLTVGTTLVFKYRVAQTATVALIAAENGGVPEAKFISTEGHPGLEQLLVRDSRTYGYAVDRGTARVRVCLVAATDNSELQAMLADLKRLWPRLGPSACRSWEVIGDLP